MILFGSTMSFLTITLDTPPVLGIRDTDSPDRIRVGPDVLLEIPSSDSTGLFLGFYDWLRNRAGGIVGLRITFHDARDSAIRSIRRTKVGEWESSDIWHLLFRPESELDESRSIDQEFSVSRLYADDGNTSMLLVDIDGVEDDIHRLLQRQ